MVGVLNLKPIGATERDTDRPDNVFDAGLANRLPLRFLLVDDNSMNPRVAGRMLGKFGYAPDQAWTGQEAIRAVGEKTYDAVLMDGEMPAVACLRVRRPIWVRRTRPWTPRIIAL